MIQNTLFILILIVFPFLGLMVYLKNPKKNINLLFLLMALSMTIWLFFNFSVDFVKSQQLALIFTKLDFSTAPLMVYLFLIFCINFPRKKNIKLISYLLLILLPVIASVTVIFSDYFVENIKNVGTGYEVIYGNYSYIYDIIIILYVIIGGIGSIIYNYLNTKSSERVQILFLSMGLIGLAIIVTLANILGQYIFPNIPTINRVGILGFLLFLSLTSYAIVKRQLFNIRVIATEVLVALIVLVLLIQTLFSQSWGEGLLRGGFLILVAYFGYLLIKSVINEIERRREVEKLTKELAHANQHLKELDKMKSEFVSIASHDLLTPVASIEGYLSMILDEKMIKITDPKLEDYLWRIYNSSKRLARLITDLLNISRIEEGRLLVQKKPIDITKTIESVIKELSIQADKHHLYLKFEKPSQELEEVFADEDQIKEILINLIGNAIKFTKTGGVTVSLEILPTDTIEDKVAQLEAKTRTIAEKQEEMMPKVLDTKTKEIIGDKQVVVHIKDTGIGIPDEELPSLFKKFYRGAGWAVSNIQGTGLGLYISKSLIEIHNGRIWVESEAGKGSDFAFSLPFASDARVLEKDKTGKLTDAEVQLKPLAKGPTREL